MNQVFLHDILNTAGGLKGVAEMLLERVLSNMLINALEAESVGSTITVGCEKKPGSSHFWVHNPGYIPPEIQSRIFDFSFSTKGRGRGLGTYSILLLGERFLRGTVGVSTDPHRGTTFRLTLNDREP